MTRFALRTLVSRLIPLATACTIGLACGCRSAPVQKFEPIETYDVDRVDRASSVSRDLIAAGLPLSARQVQALLPPAEYTMKVAGLSKFLIGQPRFDSQQVAGTMAQIHGDFVAGKEGKRSGLQTRPAEDNWQADETFSQCIIWLYRWRTPSRIAPRGLLLTHNAGLGLSGYFLVQNGMVVQAGYIARREK